MKKTLLFMCTCLLIAMTALCAAALADQYGDFTYEVNEYGSVTITG